MTIKSLGTLSYASLNSRLQENIAETNTQEQTSTQSRNLSQLTSTRPGASFINALLGLDRNADGVVDRCEFDSGVHTLQNLASDGLGADTAEKALLRDLLSAKSPENGPVVNYQVSNGNLSLRIPQGKDHEGKAKAPIRSVFSHQLNQYSGKEIQKVKNNAGVDIPVKHGDDPGDFYCEHMFFGTQLAAGQPNSSVRSNDAGEKLVGFLHVPNDSFAYSGKTVGYTQATRHKATRQVVGSGLRGYYEDITKSGDQNEPVRMMVTGFGPFSYVKNNATGEFVSNKENLDASMKHAFGDALMMAEGERVSTTSEPASTTYRYMVCDPKTQKEREVLLTVAKFDVKDAAIDPDSDKSAQALIKQICPQAVLSMGAADEQAYQAEHHADSGGLNRTNHGTTSDGTASDKVQLRDNYSLARAIANGSLQIGR